MPNPILLSSLFGALTQNVQARIDAASELNKRIFDNVIYTKYLDWDVPTIGLDFEEIIGKYNLTVAASTIGDNAKEPILGSYGLDTVKEKVLNHAITLPMSIQDYRKVLTVACSTSTTRTTLKVVYVAKSTTICRLLTLHRPLRNGLKEILTQWTAWRISRQFSMLRKTEPFSAKSFALLQ